MPRYILLLCCSLCIASFVFAGTAKITVTDNKFTPPSTNIHIGDTIIFVWSSGSHEIATLANIPKEAKSLHTTLSSAHPRVVYIPSVMGEYQYSALNHSNPAMTGVIHVGAPRGAAGMYPYLWWQDSVITNTIYFMHLESPHEDPPTFTIENAEGKEVISRTVMNSHKLDVNVDFLPKGIYTLLVESKGELHRSYIRIKM